MGGLCSGSIQENELNLEKTRREKEMLENAASPKSADDLETEFVAMLKLVEIPNASVKAILDL